MAAGAVLLVWAGLPDVCDSLPVGWPPLLLQAASANPHIKNGLRMKLSIECSSSATQHIGESPFGERSHRVRDSDVVAQSRKFTRPTM